MEIAVELLGQEEAEYLMREIKVSRDQYAALSLAKVLVTLCGLYGLDEIIFSIISIENAK